MREKKTYYKYENQSNGENNFMLKEIQLYGAGRNCFISREEAEAHFNKAYETALDKYNHIVEGLGKLKDTLGRFSYEYFIEGDTYGIYNEGAYIEFDIDDYTFKFKQD